MSIKITIPNTSSDTLTFGSANTTTAAQIAGIDSGSSNGQLALYTTASGTSTERMRIDSSGNVGIGTSSPRTSLSFGNSVGTAGVPNRIRLYDDGASTVYGFGLSAAVLSYNSGDGNHVFYTGGTSPTERMRIDSSGNLLVGATSTFTTGDVNTGGTGGIYVSTSSGSEPTLTLKLASGNGVVARFIRGGISAPVGNISITTTATAYNTSSDYRLKNSIAPMTGALEKVAALKPVTYKWNADGSDGQGFIAHELAEVEAGCVTGEKDAVDAEGNPVYQGIDTSFLVATLTAAIQELKAIITSLTDRITALENK